MRTAQFLLKSKKDDTSAAVVPPGLPLPYVSVVFIVKRFKNEGSRG
jgi:hypothetical protein